MAANPEIEQYIRNAARARSIDPEIAVEVARREALNVFDPSKPDLGGDDRSSFGVYQLHYGGLSQKMPNAGLGDEFTRATGLDARDPSTWRQQIDFSLDHAKKRGWGAWMGAAAAGIGKFQGIYPGAGGGSDVAQAADSYQPPADLYGNAYTTSFNQPDFVSPLADTLAPRVDTGTTQADETTPTKAAPPPTFDFSVASAAPPAANVEPASPAADPLPAQGLAELFKVAPTIGRAGKAVDPETGLPIARSQRAYG